MKKLYLITVLLFFIASSNAQGFIYHHKLDFKDGIAFYEGTPYTGKALQKNYLVSERKRIFY